MDATPTHFSAIGKIGQAAQQAAAAAAAEHLSTQQQVQQHQFAALGAGAATDLNVDGGNKNFVRRFLQSSRSAVAGDSWRSSLNEHDTSLARELTKSLVLNGRPESSVGGRGTPPTRGVAPGTPELRRPASAITNREQGLRTRDVGDGNYVRTETTHPSRSASARNTRSPAYTSSTNRQVESTSARRSPPNPPHTDAVEVTVHVKDDIGKREWRLFSPPAPFTLYPSYIHGPGIAHFLSSSNVFKSAYLAPSPINSLFATCFWFCAKR